MKKEFSELLSRLTKKGTKANHKKSKSKGLIKNYRLEKNYKQQDHFTKLK